MACRTSWSGREIKPKSISKWLLNKYVKQREDSLTAHRKGVRLPPKQVEQMEATKHIYVSKKEEVLSAPVEKADEEVFIKISSVDVVVTETEGPITIENPTQAVTKEVHMGADDHKSKNSKTNSILSVEVVSFGFDLAETPTR